MKRARASALALGLVLSLGLAQAQPLPASAPAPDTAALRDWFRMAELDSASGILAKLLAGQDPNVMGEKGQRALHWALMNESGAALKALLADPRTDVNAENGVGEKPLWLAALRGRLDWVQALLKRGAQLERGKQPDGARAWTTLHYAAIAPSLEVLDWLLKEGCCDLDAGSTNGSTPLMMALGYGSPDAAERLVKAGARLDLKNDLGLSAWDFARKVGRDALAERLGVPRPAGAQPSGAAAQPERY
jgi:ankyrin repeat protein